MLLNKIGEFGLIGRLKKRIKLDSSVIKGTGDDCAVLKLDKNNYQLFTCDMLVEGVDFTSNELPYLIGRKALAVSVSDIAACAGTPRYCLVSLGLPVNTRLEFVDKLMKGMLEIAKQFKINIVGGDISRAGRLTLDVGMLGIVEKKKLALRSGAEIGDVIFVTGALGGSIRGKHLNFTPRVKEARFLVKNFKVKAMIDISDGLIQDLRHILKESGTGAVIYEDLLPKSKDAHDLDEVLYMGEDFELLFAVSKNAAQKLCASRVPGFSAIGQITDKRYGLKVFDKNGKEKKLKNLGFRHF